MCKEKELTKSESSEEISGGSEPVFKQRRDTILLGLTGRTGSGCSYIASLLKKQFVELKSDFSEITDGKITNEWRQKRIINDFIKDNWNPFIVIKASDFIFYFLLLLTFDEFVEIIFHLSGRAEKNGANIDQEFKTAFEPIREDFDKVRKLVEACEEFFNNKKSTENLPSEWFENLDFYKLDTFRQSLKTKLPGEFYKLIVSNLQTLGNNIRKYGTVNDKPLTDYKGFSGLSEKIDEFISEYIRRNKNLPKRIVIDALRSPADILYFREKYAFFYLVSVSATEDVRKANFFKANMTLDDKELIDRGEDKPSGGVYDEYANIYISRCLEMSDIHLVNYGDKEDEHKRIVGQLFRYVSLILHPGLVTPTKYERVMQVALTAKLNSGCLSRQVGAAVTNDKYSVMAIGWNEVPEKQVPCSLRYVYDLVEGNDQKAFSKYEHSTAFTKLVTPVYSKFRDAKDRNGGSIQLTYCFKDIHTTGTKKQTYNQVHTRSLHAEENAFLQLAKFGSGQAVIGGKLFTTASCCVLCAKKAYQLGITDIFYIDAYPDISQSHILENGDADIQMLLFQGAIGRAYMKLYDQFIPIKDELELHYGLKVKDLVPNPYEQNTLKTEKKTE